MDRTFHDMFIERVVAGLRQEGVRFAIAGGYAVALHGAVRATADVDLIVALSEENLVAAESALNRLGLRSRLPVKADEVFRFRQEYIRNRNLIAWSFVNHANPVEIVDIILTEDLRTMKLDAIVIGQLEFPVVSRADLIRMKEKSARPQDLEDVKALRSIGP